MINRIIAIVISIISIFAFNFSPRLVSAENVAWFALDSDVSSVRQGDQFTITLNGQDTSDICTYEAVLIYDHERLELTGVKSEFNGTWYPVGPKDKNGKTYFGFIKTSGQNSENKENKISSISFKAKSTGDAIIKLESITLIDSKSAERNYNVDKNTTVRIYEGSSVPIETPEPDPTPSVTPTPAPTSVPINEKIHVKPELEQGAAVGKLSREGFDKAIEKARPDIEGIKEVTIEMSKIEGAERYVQQLPLEALTSSIMDKRIKVETPAGNITVPNNMLKEFNNQVEEYVQISIGIADKTGIEDSISAQIGERPIIEINIKVGDRLIEWNNPQAPVTISIDYKPTQDELNNSEHIVVWYIDSQGRAVPVPNGKYDPATGKVTFTTTHFSKYAVAFVKKTFNDINDFGWAKNQIEVMASKGVINGTSDTTFEPDKNITRADFIMLLTKALSLKAESTSNFSDVSSSDYYYEALGTAKKLGITEGTGDNKFNPNEQISRQDMMVLTTKALKLTGKISSTGSADDIRSFADAMSVADYAIEGVAMLIKEGIIKGDGNNIDPEGNATRAEVAVLIYRLYNK